MKFHYYKETDSLYIDLTARPSVDSQEASPGVVVDYGDYGRIVGIDIQHASQVADLSVLEADDMPVRRVSLV